jgi:2-oxoglutarate dehydrogenase E1 component
MTIAWHCNGPRQKWKGKNPRATYVGRPASAATAIGQMSRHLAQLKAFLDEALG